MNALAEAYGAHAAGRLADAERGYRAILAGEPSNADAWHLLGVIAQQQNRSQEAVDLITRAVEIAGPQPAYLSNLGIALQSLGRHDEALRTLETAAAQDAAFNTLFALGNSLRALGRLGEAETRYRAAASLQPQSASVHNNLGSTLQDMGRLDEAEAAYRRTVALQPGHAGAHYNLGLIHKNAGDREVAAVHLRKALEADPELLEARIHWGMLQDDDGALAQAAAQARLRLAHAPHNPSARMNLALALSERGLLRKRQGDAALAVALMEEALTVRPDDAVTRNNLANALLNLDRAAEAEAHLRAALKAAPAMPETHFHLGNALKAQEKHDEAIAAYEAALALRPAFFKARINLSGLLNRRGDYARALASYEAGIAADPAAELWSGRGVVLQALGQHDEALASFERACALKPDLADAQRNAGLALLMRGDYRRGWESYDWRWRAEGHAQRPFPLPQWQGEAEGGIVLWGEQGLGDKVLYAGMIPDVLARGHSVVYETDPRLFVLFERSFPGLKAVQESNPPHPLTAQPGMRWHAPLAGLGRWLRGDARAFPQRTSYLVADPARRAGFRAQLEARGGKRLIVGISWASTNPKIGRHKTSALKQWAPLLKTPGVHFVDLQYGDTTAERAAVKTELGIEITHIDGLDLREDVDGVVALAAACDLVIAVSSTTVHLAAAAGVPTWVLVPASAGSLWYWGRGGERTPWYPNVRIIRQQELDDWSAPIAEAAGRLAEIKP